MIGAGPSAVQFTGSSGMLVERRWRGSSSSTLGGRRWPTWVVQRPGSNLSSPHLVHADHRENSIAVPLHLLEQAFGKNDASFPLILPRTPWRIKAKNGLGATHVHKIANLGKQLAKPGVPPKGMVSIAPAIIIDPKKSLGR
jgi:hypothetical protein